MVTELSQLGRYALREILGDGGFATVYRAWDPILDREVALKALLPHLARQPEVRRRFLAEVRSLAALRHPNIVGFLDVGEAGGLPFFTMELLQGPTLAQLIGRSGPQPPDAVAAMLMDLASAIDYIHAAGLIHRDIKAANVMLYGAGRTVLMDFGVVRALDHTQFTQTGAALGTPETMAPEQVRGLPTGPATDIYALGILAYQLLAGRPPFVGDTAYVLHAQAYEPPPPLHALRPGLPERAYRAVEWALTKDPAQRPHSATVFAFALAGPPSITRVAAPAAARMDAPPPAAEPEPEVPPAAEQDAPQPVQLWQEIRPKRRPRWLLPVLGGALLTAVLALAVPLASAPRACGCPNPATASTTPAAAAQSPVPIMGAALISVTASPAAPTSTAAPSASPTRWQALQAWLRSLPVRPGPSSPPAVARQLAQVSATSRSTSPITVSAVDGDTHDLLLSTPFAGSELPSGFSNAQPATGTPSTSEQQHGATAAVDVGVHGPDDIDLLYYTFFPSDDAAKALFNAQEGTPDTKPGGFGKPVGCSGGTVTTDSGQTIGITRCVVLVGSVTVTAVSGVTRDGATRGDDKATIALANSGSLHLQRLVATARYGDRRAGKRDSPATQTLDGRPEHGRRCAGGTALTVNAVVPPHGVEPGGRAVPVHDSGYRLDARQDRHDPYSCTSFPLDRLAAACNRTGVAQRWAVCSQAIELLGQIRPPAPC